MPWSETTRMDQRLRFIHDFDSCRYTMSELCRLYGISRKTGYKWVSRYAEEGLKGLEDRSRAPRRCPHRTDPRCEAELIQERLRHPRWGPRKLLVRLKRRHPDWPWPAVSTAGAILKRHGLVEPRARRRPCSMPSKPHIDAQVPNELWTVDYKGEFRTGDRCVCYPLTVVDYASRYLLGCTVCTSTSRQEAQPAMQALFEEFGLPRMILSDSGSPFAAARSPRRLSRLSVWWIKLGIQPICIQPGHPEQNGCHERLHRTLKAATVRPPASNLPNQQASFDRFRQEYNDERPHESLEMRYPAELYRPSPRPYPAQLGEVEYPGHFEVRRVSSKGEYYWRNRRIFLSEIFGGDWIGMEEIDDGLWSVYFANVLLGRYDEREDDFQGL